MREERNRREERDMREERNMREERDSREERDRREKRTGGRSGTGGRRGRGVRRGTRGRRGTGGKRGTGGRREAQKNAHHKATVFHLLDNILYMGRKPDGTTAHSRRGEDGIYHVEGELVVGDKEAQFTLYKALKPALTAAGSGPILVITPIPRYVKQGCCPNATHVTNRSKVDFYTDLSRSPVEVRNNWRSFLFVDNLRRISVINPLPLFDNLPEAEGWGPDDPVHPLPPLHRELANLIIRNTDYLASKLTVIVRREEEPDPAWKPVREDRAESGPVQAVGGGRRTAGEAGATGRADCATTEAPEGTAATL